jgi:hypothetical protein
MDEAVRAQRAASIGWPLAYWDKFEAFESAFANECMALVRVFQARDAVERVAAEKVAERMRLRRSCVESAAFMAVSEFTQRPPGPRW